MRHTISVTMLGHSCVEHWMCLPPSGDGDLDAVSVEDSPTAINPLDLNESPVPTEVASPSEQKDSGVAIVA